MQKPIDPIDPSVRRIGRAWLLLPLAFPLGAGCATAGRNSLAHSLASTELSAPATPPKPVELHSLANPPAGAVRGDEQLVSTLDRIGQTEVRTVAYRGPAERREFPVTGFAGQSSGTSRLPSSAYQPSASATPDSKRLIPVSTTASTQGQLELLPYVSEAAPPSSMSDAFASEEALQVIDLGAALGMAGGNAWMIQLARQRTIEAHAKVLNAQAMWLPNLQLGVGWNKHDGRIQATNGEVIEASRSSLFVGGGSTWASAPIAGGSGGPLRLSSDLALADAYFGTRIAQRILNAERFGVSVARNTALLRAGTAYVDLVEAAGRVADGQAAINAAAELVQLTESFEQAGAGAQADVDRARTELTRLEQELQDAQRLVKVRSATLARSLRIDPRNPLFPADQVVIPIALCDDAIDLDSQVAQAMAARPEFSEIRNRIAALCLEADKAQVEPFIPRVAMAASAGSFGGGFGSNIDNTAGRSDLDLQAVWELDSLGLGVSAKRQQARSKLLQERIRLADLQDEISVEIVRAFEDVSSYRSQIESAGAAMLLAESSYERNLHRIRADEGLPIELLQAIQARAAALRARTTAVSEFNRAQLRLAFATGQLSGSSS